MKDRDGAPKDHEDDLTEELPETSPEEPQRNELADALNAAYRLLGYRQRSERELRRRLALKGFSDQIITEVLSRLREYGYVNDVETAGMLRRRAEGSRFLGRLGAGQYLQGMGIDRGLCEASLEDYDEEPVALRLALRKRSRYAALSDVERRRKLSGVLARRGFSASTIRRVLDRLREEGQDDESDLIDSDPPDVGSTE